jgi:hypothetical protein
LLLIRHRNLQLTRGVQPMSYEQMLPELARLSKEAGMPNLKDTNLSDAQTELRLWKGLGLAYPRCFVLKIDRGIRAASFASPKVVGNKAVFRKGNPIYVSTPLSTPHSGWATLLAYLKQNGIDSSINLALDKRYEPYPDAKALILEMKIGSRHTMAHYIDSTVSDDGKKAFSICEKIENDLIFNSLVNHDCRPITACSGRATSGLYIINRLCAPLMPGVMRLSVTSYRI